MSKKDSTNGAPRQTRKPKTTGSSARRGRTHPSLPETTTLHSSTTPSSERSYELQLQKAGVDVSKSVSGKLVGHTQMERRLETLAPLALNALEEDLLFGSGKDRREAAKLVLSMDGWSANDRRIAGVAPPAPVTVLVQTLPWAGPAKVAVQATETQALPAGEDQEKKE
jgi:hypothetical protein